MKKYLTYFLFFSLLFIAITFAKTNSVSAQTCSCTGDAQYNCGKYTSQAFCVQDPYCSWSCTAPTKIPPLPKTNPTPTCAPNDASKKCTPYDPSPTPKTIKASSSSDCIVTQIGNAKTTPPDCNSVNIGPVDFSKLIGSKDANKIVKAGVDIATAYSTCGRPESFTGNISGIGKCLSDVLKYFGYSDTAIAEFEARRNVAMVSLPAKAPGGTGATLCNQCNGYVMTTLSLVEIQPSQREECAASFNKVENGKYVYDGIKVGNVLYRRIGSGNSIKIQPGDVGVTGDGADCYEATGHILLVKEVTGNVSFVALESNYHSDCIVTDNVVTHPKEKYTFYRKEL